MVTFLLIPRNDARLTSELREKFIEIDELIHWSLVEPSEESYSGLIIVGKKNVSGKVETKRDFTIDGSRVEIPRDKIDEITRAVNDELTRRGGVV
jgi:hypothetical protein